MNVDATGPRERETGIGRRWLERAYMIERTLFLVRCTAQYNNKL